MVDLLKDTSPSEKLSLDFLAQKFNQALQDGHLPPPHLFKDFSPGNIRPHLPLPAVAFLGTRKPSPDSSIESVIDQLDGSMTHPDTARRSGLLYYLAAQLPDGKNYADLSVFQSPELIGAWLRNPDHQLGVEIASLVFARIALFRASLTQTDLTQPIQIQLESRRVISY